MSSSNFADYGSLNSINDDGQPMTEEELAEMQLRAESQLKLIEKEEEAKAKKSESKTTSTEGKPESQKPKPSTEASQQTEQPQSNTETSAEPPAEIQEDVSDKWMTPEEQTIAYEEEKRLRAAGELPEEEEAPVLSDTAQALAAPFAPFLGMQDFGVDLINKIPGVNVPKIPKFENDLLQAVRDISAVVAPSLALRKGLGNLGTKALGNKTVSKVANFKPDFSKKINPFPGARRWGLKDNPFVKFAGEAALDTGIGVGVDYTVKFNEEDDNALAFIKEKSPAWIGERIPIEWTTLGLTNPEQIKFRNAMEGAGFGLGAVFVAPIASIAGAAGKFTKRTQALDRDFAQAVSLSAENGVDIKQAVGGTGRNAPNTGLTPAEIDLKAQSEALDEYGAAAVASDPEALTRPTKGVHTPFDPMEQGVRTVDENGIAGALVDNAQIKGNINSFDGAVGSVVTEGRLRFGQISNGKTPVRKVVEEMAGQLRLIGKFKAVFPSGVGLDYKDIVKLNVDDSVETIGEILANPNLTLEQLNATLTPFKNDLGVLQPERLKNLSDGLDLAIRKTTEQMIDLDKVMASNIINKSLSGQVADMAEVYRIAGPNAGATDSLGDQILSRLVYIMTEAGVMRASAGRNLAALNLRKGAKNLNPSKSIQWDETLESFSELQIRKFKEAEEYANSLRQIQAVKPEYLKPLMFLNEMTGGDVRTLYDVNEYMRQNLSYIFKKGVLFDGNTQVPNLLIQGAWANFFNSTLSAIGTPIRALTGNVGGIIAKPVSILGGAALSGDIKMIQDGWMAFSAFGDTLQKGSKYMNAVFRKASTDPYAQRGLMREDLARMQADEEKLEILGKVAAADRANGDLGSTYLLNMNSMLTDLANHPWLKLGTNAMTAFDGFTRAVIANADARYAAMAELRNAGKPITREAVGKMATKTWVKMKKSDFDIGSVKYQTGEIALNLDTGMSRFISGATAQVPILRPLIMFPRTSANMIAMFDKYSPIGAFAKDINDFTGIRPFGITKLSEVPPERMKELLVNRGLVEPNASQAQILEVFARTRAEYRGRRAIGMFATLSGLYAVSQGNLTGDGVYKENVRFTNDKLGNPKRSVKLVGTDKWVSYEGLGPVSDWIATLATVWENAHYLGEAPTEKLINKLMYSLAASITNRSVLSEVEPITGILNGNGPSFNKLVANVINMTVPFSGLRAEFGRILGEGTQATSRELADYLRQRNKFISNLQPEFDWFDGQPIGTSENWLVNAFNQFTTFKVKAGVSPGREFLGRIGYDVRPELTTDGKGNELPPAIAARMRKLMAQNGRFKNAVLAEMERAEKSGFVEEVQKQRYQGVGSDRLDLSEYGNVFNRLDRALASSKKEALDDLPEADKQIIYNLGKQAIQRDDLNRSGQIPDDFKTFK